MRGEAAGLLIIRREMVRDIKKLSTISRGAELILTNVITHFKMQSREGVQPFFWCTRHTDVRPTVSWSEGNSILCLNEGSSCWQEKVNLPTKPSPSKTHTHQKGSVPGGHGSLETALLILLGEKQADHQLSLLDH